MTETTNVAIACQGGGSHTAFTAGVLEEMLRTCDWDEEFELVGISGSSGGAFNALAAWYGLVTDGPERAADLVNAIWDDLAASDYDDRLLNSWLKGINRLQASGMPLPQMSPYQVPGKEIGKERIRDVLETHIDFEAIPDYCRLSNPELVVGTVNVNAGVFETFVDEDVTVEAVLASAAVPNVFEAVEINGHYHWDGLFSQNPPVGDMMHQPPDRKPDELWIIQINPQEFEGEPTSVEEIADRRNELSGNISLNQELGFIEQINDWVEDGKLPAEEFSKTDIHRIDMGERFHCSTKIDRDPAFIDKLIDLGNQRCEQFLRERQ
ncbi:Patatin protein [Halorhabdus tiamatea SARL4B]|uniref:Patatin protein n=1 Tax=Halorhabdus tiamatea SARL4B TaxID=1033806 RepID=F7PFQ6_9EURY|nr:patatin-like phospholipase family protein [Halorhabdus tiamatea]ERJ05140.1 Patatin protein [Halorhabdus tiamatea SARL4B]CCQ32286.1 patatin-like phospholipase [Halorhabdus tiamatea SARL4B]